MPKKKARARRTRSPRPATTTVRSSDLPAEPCAIQPPQQSPDTLVAQPEKTILVEPPGGKHEANGKALVERQGEQQEAREANLVLKARDEMRQDMCSRLSGMMANLRSSLQIELVEVHSALREATLQMISTRLESINLQLERKISPLLKPSIRATLKEMTGILSGVFLQMLVAANPEGKQEELTSQSREMAEQAIKDLVPNSSRLA